VETQHRPAVATRVVVPDPSTGVRPCAPTRPVNQHEDRRASQSPWPACMKCGGRMCFYDRSGVVVEQCEDCRGIFLDQGELERLIDTEGGGWSGMVREPRILGPRTVPARRRPSVPSLTAMRGEPIAARAVERQHPHQHHTTEAIR
jgi:Zn-finger nucleic acid-binding protein